MSEVKEIWKTTEYNEECVRGEIERHFAPLYPCSRNTADLICRLLKISHEESTRGYDYSKAREEYKKLYRAISKMDMFVFSAFGVRYVQYNYIYDAYQSFEYVVRDYIWEKENRS